MAEQFFHLISRIWLFDCLAVMEADRTLSDQSVGPFTMLCGGVGVSSQRLGRRRTDIISPRCHSHQHHVPSNPPACCAQLLPPLPTSLPSITNASRLLLHRRDRFPSTPPQTGVAFFFPETHSQLLDNGIICIYLVTRLSMKI